MSDHDPGLGEPELAEPGNRGRLILRDKVAQRLAIHAALQSDGVHAHAGGLDKLTGRELPRATVWVSGDRARVQVHVAVAWPKPAAAVGETVQRNVIEALSSYAALTVDRVDVAIDAVVPAPSPTRTLQ